MSLHPRKFLLLSGAFFASCVTSRPQEKPDAPQPKPAVLLAQQHREKEIQPLAMKASASPTPQKQDENTKRILGLIPNFQSKDDIPENRKPMTPREKYALAFHQTVDFSAHFGDAFQAMLQQASDAQPHYGQGWRAYAQRFGAAEGDRATSAFFIYGFLPHVLKEDPRYLRKRNGSVWSRITYSASRTVITRTDAGTYTFNNHQVFGQLLQQGISTAYYPEQDRTAPRVFQNWGINLAYTSAYNILKEFYPDFLRIVFRRHPKPIDPPH